MRAEISLRLAVCAGRGAGSVGRAAVLGLAIAAAAIFVGGASAQDDMGVDGATAAEQAAAGQDVKIPAPEDIDLRTEDGVRLKTTYYPGTRGKETVPIVLLHAFKGSRNDYVDLALYLQELGHAVMVPDLRGHGESTRVEGWSRPLDASTLPPQALERMVEDDMESVKMFLMDRNNAGELNVDRLGVVGAEMGAAVALDWARLDWSWPPLAVGKQGQDVKALVLISPPWSFHGLNVRQAVASPSVREELSILLVVGKEQPQAVRDARRLQNMFRRYHPEPPRDKATQLQDFFYRELDTSLQGTKMLGVSSLNLPRWIAAFIDLRLVKPSYPWKDRTKPI